MQLIIKGKNIELTDQLRDYVTKKLGRLDHYLPSLAEVRVELSVQNVKSSRDSQVVQVTMRSNSSILRAEERSADIFAAVDAVRDKLQRQIKRFKEKSVRVRERAQAAARAAEMEAEAPPPRIVRTKRFSTFPMNPDEAIEQMELLGHDFFVFYNSEDDQLNVLYRRRDGNYGLLQPELG